MVSEQGLGKMGAKKKGKKNIRDQNISELASRLEEEFVCLSSSASTENWYIDSGASAHMTREREYFLSYQEEQMNFQITMGNRTKCTLVGKGTVIFQTAIGDSLRATNVLHMSDMGMNLIFVAQLQDKGYDVYFIGNRVYVKHPRWKNRARLELEATDYTSFNSSLLWH